MTRNRFDIAAPCPECFHQPVLTEIDSGWECCCPQCLDPQGIDKLGYTKGIYGWDSDEKQALEKWNISVQQYWFDAQYQCPQCEAVLDECSGNRLCGRCANAMADAYREE